MKIGSIKDGQRCCLREMDLQPKTETYSHFQNHQSQEMEDEDELKADVVQR